MATTRHLIVFGAAMALAALVLAYPTPLPFEPLEGFFECRQKTLAQRGVMKECLGEDFTDEAMNATMELYKDSRCPLCKHVCSKQDVIRRCLRESWDVLALLSNKSVEMVPFVRSLVEESLHTLCDNDAALLSVFLDEENSQCLTDAWRTCQSRLEGAEDFNLIAFCDFTDIPDLDPYSKPFICQKYMDLFECGEEETGRCSEELKTSVTQVMSIWRNQTSCSKYFHTTE
ncbi:uncharacterized protein LOC124154378 isoform X1 [Ischnura elegans]|uniref:uncharacterized protein LOC124154378 isoform X1 n=1 Tax=Ischnura elegans TaxID=197161 RepID=UPI001ED867DF|nr:uncharacterized protein LOC124154378 isoform X1 [Ischnura elegans]